MLKTLKKGRGKIYKFLHIFSISVLVLNMSMLGVFFNPQNAYATHPDPQPTCSDKPELEFTDDYGWDCEKIWAEVCNIGSGDMESAADVKVYYSADSEPKNDGLPVTLGTIQLEAGECETLEYETDNLGNYRFKIWGPIWLWSEIIVASECSDGECGNGQVEGDEECDDGNDVQNDYCSNQCIEQQPICHATASAQNPYNLLWVDDSAIDGVGANDHTQHLNDIIPIWDVDGDQDIDEDDCVKSTYECGNGQVEGDEECDDENLDNGDGCNEFCEKEVIVKAYKVVCDKESDLPNWGEGDINLITANTASDYIAQHPDCHWANDPWEFQYGSSIYSGNGDVYGPISVGDWALFDSATNGSEPAKLVLDWQEDMAKLWFREVLQEGYIPYAYPPAPKTGDLYSAELYCDDDILNYDNMEWIDWNPERDEYYCIAFNVPEKGNLKICKQNDLDGDGVLDDGEPIVPGWTFNIGDASYTDEDQNGCVDVELLFGKYSITENMVEGWEQTGASGNGTLESDGSVTINIDSSEGTKIIYFLNQEIEQTCGNKVLDEGEQCDDGNNDDGDGCSATCQIEYCGDGIVNQAWEECDDGDDSNPEDGCHACQEDGVCSDMVLVRVNIDEQNSDIAPRVYLGSATDWLPNGAWFPLYHNAAYIGPDGDLDNYENVEVPGLAVERQNGSVRVNLYRTGGALRHAEGNIEFYNANVSDLRDDPENPLEKGFNTTKGNASDDEVWIEDGLSKFWLGVTTGDDAYYTDWNIIEDCIDVCGDGQVQWPNQDGQFEECDGTPNCNQDCTLITDPVCEEGEIVELDGYMDYVNIGDETSEAGHNLNYWSDAWMKPGWGGNYGGGSSDETFRLLMGHGDGCGDTYEMASLTLDADDDYVNQVTFEHLDGSVDDSFDVYVNNVLVGHYTGGQNQSETWVTSSFDFPPMTGELTIKLVATEPDNAWCANWGQVAFSWVGITGYTCAEDPYCGDGMIDQAWEECDGLDTPEGETCDARCQIIDNECSDKVFARVNIPEDGIQNGSEGNMTNRIFLGSSSYDISAGTWFLLSADGVDVNDPDVSNYEDVPGLAVQRLNGQVRVVMYGSRSGSDADIMEHADGNIEFYNASVTGQENDPANDYPGNNTLEGDYSDGSGIGKYKAGDDEIWTEDGLSKFWLTTTTADDGFYTNWSIIEDCEGSICGYKYNHYTDLGIPDWDVYLKKITACEAGDEWADTVVEYDNNGTTMQAGRNLPGKALGEAEMDDTMNFVSLGMGGHLILEFDNYIINEAGPDIEVIETSYGSPSCVSYPEYVKAYASQDGSTWVDLGGRDCQEGESQFELGSLSWAKYVKLVDMSGNQGDGYDVDGVRALHCAADIEVLQTATTNDSGRYCFDQPEEGDYRVEEELRQGWNYYDYYFQDISYVYGNELEIDFRNYVVPGSITVCKLIDDDRNLETTDDQHEPEGAWSFSLSQDGQGEIAAASTGDTNCVTFSDLAPSEYTVSEAAQEGWYALSPADGNTTVLLESGEEENLTFINAEELPNCDLKIQGYKYHAWGDGLGLPGWTIELRDMVGALKGSTVTNENGYYVFNGLCEYGTYNVSEVGQFGWEQVYPVNPNSHNVTVTVGNNMRNFENRPTVHGCKYDDADGDGVIDEGEEKLGDWEIELYACIPNPTCDDSEPDLSLGSCDVDCNFSLIATTTTEAATSSDNFGCYEFANLDEGTSYQVKEVNQTGWNQTYPNDPAYYEFVYGEDDTESYDFANNYPTASISGCKYNDSNYNGVIDEGEEKLSGWEIQLIRCLYLAQGLTFSPYDNINNNPDPGLSGYCSVIDTITTGEDGCYEFTGLAGGSYGVAEVQKSGWSQQYPIDNTYYFFGLDLGEATTTIDFVNSLDCGDEYCDENAGENCETCSRDCGSCGGGGGGGGGSELLIINPQVVFDCDSATVTWLTNKPATTRVVYDTVSHPDANAIGGPNYGYANSTDFDANKTTGHTVVITGLTPGVPYYFRPISSASPEKIGKELGIAMIPETCCAEGDETCGVIVKGEEGAPILNIKKEVATSFANPGDTGIEYIITVTNTGNLTAYAVTLVDTLPDGLTYSGTTDTARNWDLGDIAPDESKAVNYTVDVSSNAEYKVYTNTAVANASNHGPVTDTVDLEVREISVLAATGFSVKEFIFLATLLLALAGTSIFLRRKIA